MNTEMEEDLQLDPSVLESLSSRFQLRFHVSVLTSHYSQSFHIRMCWACHITVLPPGQRRTGLIRKVLMVEFKATS